MKISICITVLNEEKTISSLLESLLNQTKRADEIIIVDGGSTDKTLEIIKHYQKKNKSIKLLKERCSRAKGRNLAIELARNNIIAITDAGCLANKYWLNKITAPFNHESVDVVAGFYKMITENAFQKALSVFIGVLPSKFDVDFLPSSRSIAFRKELWERVGGFSESQNDTAEDTVFNYKILKNNAKISRVKDAIVEWRIPNNLPEAFLKFYKYAQGDAKSKIIIFPQKGLASHNIKVIFVFIRYVVGLSFLVFSFMSPPLFSLFFFFVLLYLIWSFRKAGLWGIVLQLTSDVAVMLGFIHGLF